MGPIKAIDSYRMRENFSGHAQDYDSYSSVQKCVVGLLSEKILKNISLKGRILDIGTGTGALASGLEASLSEQLVVMDIAHGMTREASQRVSRCFACDGDARSLPFASNSFAGVVSSSVYQWVSCLPAAFAEVERVLAPGGFFAVALFGERTLFELRDSHRKAVSLLNQQKASHVQNFPALAEVEEAITVAGMECKELTTSIEVDYHPDVPNLLRQLKKIGASNAAADRPKGLASRRVMKEMMSFYETAFRSAEGLPASYEVLIAIAQKKKAA